MFQKWKFLVLILVVALSVFKVGAIAYADSKEIRAFSPYMSNEELGTKTVTSLIAAKSALGKGLRISGKLEVTPRSLRKSQVQNTCGLITESKFLNKLKDIENTCHTTFREIILYTSFNLQPTTLQIDASSTAKKILYDLDQTIKTCKKMDALRTYAQKALSPLEIENIELKTSRIVNAVVEDHKTDTFNKITSFLDQFYKDRSIQIFQAFKTKCAIPSLDKVLIDPASIRFADGMVLIYFYGGFTKELQKIKETTDLCQETFVELEKFNKEIAMPHGYYFDLDLKRFLKGFVKTQDIQKWMAFFSTSPKKTFYEFTNAIKSSPSPNRIRRATITMPTANGGERSYIVVNFSSIKRSSILHTLATLTMFVSGFPVTAISGSALVTKADDFSPITIQVPKEPQLPESNEDI